MTAKPFIVCLFVCLFNIWQGNLYLTLLNKGKLIVCLSSYELPFNLQ